MVVNGGASRNGEGDNAKLERARAKYCTEVLPVLMFNLVMIYNRLG